MYIASTGTQHSHKLSVKLTDLKLKCNGIAGHGSLLHAGTAGEKAAAIISRFMQFRRHEQYRLASSTELTIGDVTTVNLTALNGGKLGNVVPPSFSVTFDLRLANDVSHEVFLAMVIEIYGH